MTEERACANKEDMPRKDIGDVLTDAWYVFGLLVAADLISDEATAGSHNRDESTALISVIRVAVEQSRALALELDRING